MSDFPVKTLVPVPFAFLLRSSRIQDMKTSMPQGFAELMQAFGQAGVTPSGPPLAHYLTYDNDATTFELGFPVQAADAERLRASGLRIGETCAGPAMVATHIGAYDTVVGTYDAMMAAMQAERLEAGGDMWEIYASPPETPPERTRTEIIWPVKALA